MTVPSIACGAKYEGEVPKVLMGPSLPNPPIYPGHSFSWKYSTRESDAHYYSRFLPNNNPTFLNHEQLALTEAIWT